jgi:leucyl-tRNA synthetase
MYSRFWHKFLFDLGYVHTQEPFKKLVNQGMIQGEINRLFLRKKQTEFDSTEYADANYVKDFNIEEFVPVEVPLKFVKKDVNGKSFLDKAGIDEFLAFRGNDLRVLVHKKEAEEKWMLDSEIGKMSKRYHNVVNPDEVVAEYGADCFRMYEMFLGPLEQSKPWDTKGISGVAGFLRRYFSLFWNANDEFYLTDEEPSREELKVLHTCIKKVNQDTESLSFNTSVSAFMICVNSLKSMACTKRQILIPLTQLLAPFAPFITEEVWHLAGNSGSIQHSKYPEANEDFLVEDSVNYPVSVNGKKRYEWKVSKAKPKSELESEVLELDEIKKWIDGVQIKKIIIVPERMINIVL